MIFRLSSQAPVDPIALNVGDHVKLAHGPPRWWWRVQAVSEHFVACVHQAEFKPQGELCYTVLDWRNGVRGPCDLIGHCYGDGSYSEAECAQMLAEFEHHEIFAARVLAAAGPVPSEPTLEVSYRNRVNLNITDVRTAAA